MQLSREEIARIELGHTAITPATARVLVFLFLAIIGLVPLVQEVYRHQAARNEAPGGASPTLLEKTDRAWAIPTPGQIKAFEREVEDRAWLRAGLLPPLQAALTGVLGAGNEQVYPGREGWLFYRQSLDHLSGPGFLEPASLRRRARSGDETTAAPQPDPVRAIVHFRDALRRRGIELLVVPAPAKPAIYPDKFSARYAATGEPVNNPSFRQFLTALADAGVQVVDPAPALMAARVADAEPLYLKSDTHWTPRGLALTAELIVAAISGNGLAPAERTYQRAPSRIANSGDIAGMLRLPEDTEPAASEEVEIQQVLQPDGSLWTASRDAEILLLGDSFSNIYSLEGMGWGASAGLAEQLSAALQRPLDKITINDGAAFRTREFLQRQLRQGDDRLAGKRWVIFQFAARELSFGDWKILPLEVGQERLPDSPDTSIVSATVIDRAHPPRPGSVPYRDAVASLALDGVTTHAGPERPGPLYIFYQAMRDNRLTPMAGLQIGARVRLELVPWSSVAETWSAYRRLELDDPAYLDLAPYWARPVAETSPAEAIPAPASREDATLAAKGAESPAAEMAQTRQVPVVAPGSLAAEIATLEAAGKSVFPGRDGWHFFLPELRFLDAGPFWGERATTVSRAENPAFADPLPAILDFKAQLDAAGVELILLPVPAKASIYPDKLGSVALPEHSSTAEFFTLLQARGITLIDLEPVFKRARDQSELYLKGDTHWSPAAISLTARHLAEFLAGRDWVGPVPKQNYQIRQEQSQFSGDLAHLPGGESIPAETWPIDIVRREDGGPLTPWRGSPLLLLGDSHTLVFHEGGDLFARGAGLPDQLARYLGFPVDLIGVRGSGATPARLSLMRRRDNLAGKRLVVWCFTVREFTESAAGWRQVPVVRR